MSECGSTADPIKLRDFGYANSDALSVYGILTGMVFSTIMFPCVLSNSLSVMLLPAIAEANSRKQYNPGAKSHPENHTAVCHSRSCVYLRISAVRKLDRHPSVSQHTGRYLCAHPELDLSVFIPRKHTVQHFARTWQGYPHHADQPGWCRHRIIFVFAGIPRIGLSAYLWGMLASQILICALAFFCLHHAPEYVPEK